MKVKDEYETRGVIPTVLHLPHCMTKSRCLIHEVPLLVLHLLPGIPRLILHVFQFIPLPHL